MSNLSLISSVYKSHNRGTWGIGLTLEFFARFYGLNTEGEIMYLGEAELPYSAEATKGYFAFRIGRSNQSEECLRFEATYSSRSSAVRENRTPVYALARRRSTTKP